jgi:hypothetical protein
MGRRLAVLMAACAVVGGMTATGTSVARFGVAARGNAGSSAAGSVTLGPDACLLQTEQGGHVTLRWGANGYDPRTTVSLSLNGHAVSHATTDRRGSGGTTYTDRRERHPHLHGRVGVAALRPGHRHPGERASHQYRDDRAARADPAHPARRPAAVITASRRPRHGLHLAVIRTANRGRQDRGSLGIAGCA